MRCLILAAVLLSGCSIENSASYACDRQIAQYDLPIREDWRFFGDDKALATLYWAGNVSIAFLSDGNECFVEELG